MRDHRPAGLSTADIAAAEAGPWHLDAERVIASAARGRPQRVRQRADPAGPIVAIYDAGPMEWCANRPYSKSAGRQTELTMEKVL